MHASDKYGDNPYCIALIDCLLFFIYLNRVNNFSLHSIQSDVYNVPGSLLAIRLIISLVTLFASFCILCFFKSEIYAIFPTL